MYPELQHRDLDQSTFAAALAKGGGAVQMVFVLFESPAGKASCQRETDKFGVNKYAVSFNGSIVATGRSTLTLAELNTLVGFTSEPQTLAEEVADHESRITALENA